MAKLRKNKYKRLINEQSAIISINQGECLLDSDVDVMGIQIHFSGKAVITPALPEGWIMQGNNNIILMFALQNVPIQKQLLFTYKGEINISKLIVSDAEGIRLYGNGQRDSVNWLRQSFEIDKETTTWDNIKDKNKNAIVKKTSYNLPNYNLPKVDKTKLKRKVKKNIQKIRTRGY